MFRINISTHSLTKRLTTHLEVRTTGRIFQLTASRRGWLEALGLIDFPLDISTHSLTKRLSLSGFSETAVKELFQLTASRRGWHCYRHNILLFQNISTHSLTKRLTVSQQQFASCACISTHSLTKRLTTVAEDSGYVVTFQLTASRRGWQWMILH